jgi:hypothetical protein
MTPRLEEAIELVFTYACVESRNHIIDTGTMDKEEKFFVLANQIEKCWPEAVEKIFASHRKDETIN